MALVTLKYTATAAITVDTDTYDIPGFDDITPELVLGYEKEQIENGDLEPYDLEFDTFTVELVTDTEK